MDTKPKSQQRYADPHTKDTSLPERRNHPQQEQTNHDVWVELVIADRPMEFSVPRSKRNPPVDFVITKEQRNENYAYFVCFWNRRRLLSCAEPTMPVGPWPGRPPFPRWELSSTK